MNNGISKKVHITSMVFTGLLVAMANAETWQERLIICGIIGACFVLYMAIQGRIDCSNKEKGMEQ